MTARFVPIGEPAHDAERQALRFLVDNLPDEYIVYGNPWLVERSGAVYELDGPHSGDRWNLRADEAAMRTVARVELAE